MYKDGLKIGDIFYLVSEEDGKISLLSGSTKKENMEEYIKLDNEYFEKIENINNIQNKLINIHNLDRLSRKWNIRILLTNMLVGGFSLLIGHTITISIVGLIILNSGLLIKLSIYAIFTFCSSKKFCFFFNLYFLYLNRYKKLAILSFIDPFAPRSPCIISPNKLYQKKGIIKIPLFYSTNFI